MSYGQIQIEDRKFVKKQDYFLVSGFIRLIDCQYQYQYQYQYQCPTSIITLCIIYFLNFIDKYSSNIIISGDNNETITCNDKRRGNVYGSFWIHSLSKKIITYKILVNNQSTKKYSSVNSIGITSNDNYLIDQSLQEIGNTYYCLLNDGCAVSFARNRPNYLRENEDKISKLF